MVSKTLYDEKITLLRNAIKINADEFLVYSILDFKIANISKPSVFSMKQMNFSHVYN